MKITDSTDTQNLAQPNILKMKVYEVNGKPLYYQDHSNKVYNIPNKEWENNAPEYLDYFDARPIEKKDLHSLMLNNLMDNNDYEALNSAQLIEEPLQALWAKLQELNEKLTRLEELEQREHRFPEHSDPLLEQANIQDMNTPL